MLPALLTAFTAFTARSLPRAWPSGSTVGRARDLWGAPPLQWRVRPSDAPRTINSPLRPRAAERRAIPDRGDVGRGCRRVVTFGIGTRVPWRKRTAIILLGALLWFVASMRSLPSSQLIRSSSTRCAVARCSDDRARWFARMARPAALRPYRRGVDRRAALLIPPTARGIRPWSLRRIRRALDTIREMSYKESVGWNDCRG